MVTLGVRDRYLSIRKKSLLWSTSGIRLDPVSEALALETEAGPEDKALSAHLPPEKQLSSDPLIITSHPEWSGCCRLPLPECTPQIEFLERANKPSLAVVGRVNSPAVRAGELGQGAQVLGRREGELIGRGPRLLPLHFGKPVSKRHS